MIWLVAFLGCIVAANLAVEVLGIVPVGFGLYAPAAVYFVGLTFTFRDLAHDRLGRGPVLVAIVLGALLSYVVAPQVAVASGVAFLLSESTDLLVYSPLRSRSWLGAVALSNTVGLLIDSVVFLWLAFGSLAFLPGQVVGKATMTVLAVVVLLGARRVVSERGRAT